MKTPSFFSGPKIRVIAHRGGAGLAPENTMVAFENAAALGVDVLEMDIHSTSDNVLVVIHDDTVDRTTNGTGFVHNFTLAELKQLDAGYHWTNDESQTFPYRGQGVTIPTLEEVFNAFPDIRMNIDIKQRHPSIVEPFGNMILKKERIHDVLVGSFHLGAIKTFRRLLPQVSTSGVYEVGSLLVLMFLGAGKKYRPICQAFQLPEYYRSIRLVSKPLIRIIHHHLLEIHVWTVNDVSDMERLLAMGIDAIITDYPHLLLDLLERPNQ